MELWKKAIENHKKLVDARPDPSFWADNIIEATRCLGDQASDDWKVFYSYLCESPVFFNPEKAKTVESLGDLKELPSIPDYPEGTTFECHKNGTEYIIIVKPKRTDEEPDDEKLPQ